jgi:HAD hydrolase, TIGR02254 family
LIYKQIIFDIDDTIIDFDNTEYVALNSLFKFHGWNITPEIRKNYHAYNQGLWRLHEQGKLTYEELSEICFRDFIKREYDIDVNGKQVMAEYRHYFGNTHKLIPGAKEALQYFKNQGYYLAALSNGETFMQKKRLKLANVAQYFDLIITSQEAQASKPNPAIFDYFFSRSKVSVNQSLLFGDGLSSDILGATNYGLDCVWFNHCHRKNLLRLTPLLEVDTYSDFIKYCKNH